MRTTSPGVPAARTASALRVPVALGWQVADGVLVMTATTPRRGGSRDDCWSISPSVALASTTLVDACVGRTCYVSRAWVGVSALAHDTTYTFSYSIVMRTSGCTWAGSSSDIVTVGAEGALTALGTADARA